MPRQRKQKPKAVILPIELDDDEDETASVIPDDDGWITLEDANGTVAKGNGDPVAGTGDGKSRNRVARKASRRRPRNAS